MAPPVYLEAVKVFAAWKPWSARAAARFPSREHIRQLRSERCVPGRCRRPAIARSGPC